MQHNFNQMEFLIEYCIDFSQSRTCYESSRQTMDDRRRTTEENADFSLLCRLSSVVCPPSSVLYWPAIPSHVKARYMSWSKQSGPSGPRGYHHGNLKEALIRAALALIAQKGTAGFTFAEAARWAGVSPAAPYRHFSDRDELIVALGPIQFG